MSKPMDKQLQEAMEAFFGPSWRDAVKEFISEKTINVESFARINQNAEFPLAVVFTVSRKEGWSTVEQIATEYLKLTKSRKGEGIEDLIRLVNWNEDKKEEEE